MEAKNSSNLLCLQKFIDSYYSWQLMLTYNALDLIEIMLENTKKIQEFMLNF